MASFLEYTHRRPKNRCAFKIDKYTFLYILLSFDVNKYTSDTSILANCIPKMSHCYTYILWLHILLSFLSACIISQYVTLMSFLSFLSWFWNLLFISLYFVFLIMLSKPSSYCFNSGITGADFVEFNKSAPIIPEFIVIAYTEVGVTTTQNKLRSINLYGIPTVVLRVVVI